MTVSTALEILMFGLSLGMVYLLITIGLSIIFGLMDVINFAHGAFVTLGAYIGLTTWAATGEYWVALVVLTVVVAGLGGILEYTLFKRLYEMDHIMQLIMTFGIALAIEGSIMLYYGQNLRSLNVPEFVSGNPISLGPALIPRYRIFIILFTLLVLAGMWLVYQNTRLGLVIKAGIQDRERIQLLGIDIDRTYTVVFAVGAGLAGIAGFLAGPILAVSPTMGSHLIIISFAIVIIGGIGNIRGSVVASVLIGIVYTASLTLYPAAANASIYGLMAVTLIFKPAGLFGGGQ